MNDNVMDTTNEVDMEKANIINEFIKSIYWNVVYDKFNDILTKNQYFLNTTNLVNNTSAACEAQGKIKCIKELFDWISENKAIIDDAHIEESKQ